MKKISNLLTALFLTLIVASLSSCASNKIFFDDRQPVAILSVECNPSLPWLFDDSRAEDGEADDDGTGLISGIINKAAGKNNPEIYLAQDRCDYAAQALHDLFRLTADIDTVPHDELADSFQYQASSKNFLDYLASVTYATNYKNLNRTGAKRLRMIFDEVGAKSGVIAKFVFKKQIVAGSNIRGSVAVLVKMHIRYINDRGVEIINTDYETTSDITPMRMGKYDKDDLCQKIPDAIDNVINQFLMDHIR